MGDCNSDDFRTYTSATSFVDDRRFSKHVHDNVHGNIYLDRLSLKFIDTEQFQRLRDLKQLGLTYMVYPGAVHSRFEHSLGVYWLASDAVNRLRTCQGRELGIESFDVQTVKLAGLLHDVGHGPFSHMFEREFLPRVRDGLKWSHEDMSLKMIDYIVDEHGIDIDSDCLKKVKIFIFSLLWNFILDSREMIVASEEGNSVSSKEKQFLYDIVANGRNGIDVDKFDYIERDTRACGLGCNFQFQRLLETMRVMDNEICYRAKEYLTIHKLFSTRADLHRTVYMHPKVKAIELMVVDALIKANDHLQIASYIDEPAQYWMLDDTIVKRIETSTDQELEESRNLIRRIRRRDIYQFCNEFAVPKEKLEHFKNVTAQDIACSQNSDAHLNEEDVIVTNVKIDLASGRNNPLERISFFQDYDSFEKFPIKDDRISHLLPACYQDMIVRVYTRKSELVEAVSEAFENFQLKTYGKKTQVHATPEKKKRLKY
ncbi:PREDICTED: deoxynucleoside triphosphate triphosphohydrolase SAMHD1 homolog isoform X1 [Nicotiana attenuata]|uniref:deoxynucleoside triphosphate triphosphohydrolase SAMHD1 homolog isoform X1 n=1 Tax=Nicotiana attenuata TaxID=49451 RepID=UPI000904C7D6|nr:PREDICTED: deoxynucleoside triphosphate triphosphohydrolase SAMHD1 homolog isoform X1 [Nicotiana attenuata]